MADIYIHTHTHIPASSLALIIAPSLLYLAFLSLVFSSTSAIMVFLLFSCFRYTWYTPMNSTMSLTLTYGRAAPKMFWMLPSSASARLDYMKGCIVDGMMVRWLYIVVLRIR